MKLMTDEIAAALPRPYSTESVPLREKIAVAKFFDPTGRGTWYVLEGQPSDDGDWYFFTWCVSPLGPDCDELGYVSLNELQSVKGRMGLGIERDIHWTPTKLGEVVPRLNLHE
jgi:hypothetical protein